LTGKKPEDTTTKIEPKLLGAPNPNLTGVEPKAPAKSARKHRLSKKYRLNRNWWWFKFIFI